MVTELPGQTDHIRILVDEAPHARAPRQAEARLRAAAIRVVAVLAAEVNHAILRVHVACDSDSILRPPGGLLVAVQTGHWKAAWEIMVRDPLVKEGSAPDRDVIL